MAANEPDALPVVNMELQPETYLYRLRLVFRLESCIAIIDCGQSTAVLPAHHAGTRELALLRCWVVRVAVIAAWLAVSLAYQAS